MYATIEMSKAVDRKVLEVIKNMPAEEFKASIVRSFEEGCDIASIPWVLGVNQAVEKLVIEYCKSL